MQKPSRVRKRFTPLQRQEILDSYRLSSLTQSQFAAQQGISVSGLQLWLRQRATAAPKSTPARLVPIANWLSAPAFSCAYRLQLANGVVLEARQGFNPAEVQSLLQWAAAL